MKHFQIALIGCGRIGFLLEDDPLRYKPCSHWGGVTASGMKINYASDINRERLYKFSRLAKLPEENTFTDYKELLTKVKPEFVIIAAWTEMHAEIGILASINGARIIVAEKPIASNLNDAKRLLKECEKRNVSLIINHERRYDDRYRMVKKLIHQKKIGNIKTVHASILTSGYTGHSNIEEGGGPLVHDGTHMIDILRYLLGEIISVKGEIQRVNRNKGFEDRAVAWLKTDNGADIFLEAGGNREYYVFELAISGTKGKIVIGNGYERIYLNEKSRYYTGFRDLSEKSFPKTGNINCFKREYLEAKSIIGGKKIDITSKGADGYKAMETIYAIYLSSHRNSKRIELPISPAIIDLKKIFNL